MLNYSFKIEKYIFGGKMKCSKVKKMISSHLDGELNSIRIKKLEMHMDGCSGCRNEYEYFKTLGNIRAPEKIESPGDFRINFWNKVAEKEEERKAKAGRLILVPVYAAAIMFFVITTYSVSLLHAYVTNVNDKELNRNIVESYLKNGVLSAAITPVACYKLLENCQMCIHEACCATEDCVSCSE
jgi:predicted anti-sigma-YlaC factor YlaD